MVHFLLYKNNNSSEIFLKHQRRRKIKIFTASLDQRPSVWISNFLTFLYHDFKWLCIEKLIILSQYTVYGSSWSSAVDFRQFFYSSHRFQWMEKNAEIKCHFLKMTHFHFKSNFPLKLVYSGLDMRTHGDKYSQTSAYTRSEAFIQNGSLFLKALVSNKGVT